MKKKLIVTLILLLCAVLCLVACKDDPHSVTITCDQIRLPVGSAVNWSERVSITVDGVKVDSPKVTATLANGDPSKAGNATYTLSYTYEEQTYTTTVTVEFYENSTSVYHTVQFSAAPTQINVGQTPDWASIVTVTVDGTAKTDLQLTPTLVSGNPQAAGQCVYTVSVQIDGQKYTSNNITVTYVAPKSDPVVVISCPRLKVDVGQTPDWAANVKVTVDGTELKNFNVTATLDSGSATSAGAAVYILSLTYEGTVYKQPVTVDFVAVPVVLFNCAPFNQYIGEAIDWAAKATPIVDGGTVSNPQIKAELTDGNPQVAGDCTYKLTFTYNSRKYTCNTTVTYSESPVLTEAEGRAFDAMLAKQYTSLKFTYKYEVPEDDAWESQIELVQGANYYITHAYHIPTLSEPDVEEKYYLEVNTSAQTIRLVYQSANDSKWYYQITDFEQAAEDDLIPYMFTMAEFTDDVNHTMFEKAGVNTYKANDRYLTTVAGVFLNLEATTPESIVIKTDGTNVTELKLTFTATDAQGDFRVTLTYGWSNFNDTTVEIPESEEYVAPVEKPEFPDPSQAVELTETEKANLTSALAKTYAKISYGFNVDSGSSNFTNTYVGKFDSQSGKGYHYYKEWAILSGQNPSTGEIETEEWIYNAQEFYVSKLEGALGVYQMIGGDYVYGTTTDLTYDSWQSANYVAVADLLLTADMFGKLDNKYIVKADKLEAVFAKLNAALTLTDETYKDVTLKTCVVTLDASNNVTELYFVVDGMDRVSGTGAEAQYKELYKQCTLTYSEFNTASVTLPIEKQLTNLTADQATELENALKQDFSNVTVTESVSESVFKFDGDETLALEHLESQYKYDETYYIKVDGTWYKKLGQETDALTQAYEQLVLTFDFTKLDVSAAQFNSVNNTYYFAMTHEQIVEFAQYYYNFADLYKEDAKVDFGGFKAVQVTVDQGKIVKITLLADEQSVSATFSDYGTTVVVQDEEVA